MALFKKKYPHMEKLREVLNGTIETAGKEFEEAHNIRVNAYHGHGPNKNNISEADALRSDEAYEEANKKLAKKLREIAADIENKKIVFPVKG